MDNLILDLSNPQALPDKTDHVTVVQTHISIVFVADHYVYKVKKPVNFGFLDFSTLDKRQYYCHREVELNRRLSKDLYLGVLPIHYNGQHFIIGSDEGEIVEYAVKMKRIPEHRLMINVFRSGNLDERYLRKIATVLGRFHSTAETSPEIEIYGQPDRFKLNTDENFSQVEKYQGLTIEKPVFLALREWTNRFYGDHHNLFHRRIAGGHIRDCHGDLHMEHICLTQELPIFDCIEFNERFRYSDTVADIAFLLMDLEYHGGYREAGILWKIYKEIAREEGVERLLTFYKIYRAFVRGKVNSFQVEDGSINTKEKEKAIRAARQYFQLAYSYIDNKEKA